mmetsp:Transcript_10572/g.43134  ORF Transcript_10572/g.43134 Transcript_10572/m.43134 type:complete len:217 (-) Transcript_10572:816-1466(-)
MRVSWPVLLARRFSMQVPMGFASPSGHMESVTLPVRKWSLKSKSEQLTFATAEREPSRLAKSVMQTRLSSGTWQRRSLERSHCRHTRRRSPVLVRTSGVREVIMKPSSSGPHVISSPPWYRPARTKNCDASASPFLTQARTLSTPMILISNLLLSSSSEMVLSSPYMSTVAESNGVSTTTALVLPAVTPAAERSLLCERRTTVKPMRRFFWRHSRM